MSSLASDSRSHLSIDNISFSYPLKSPKSLQQLFYRQIKPNKHGESTLPIFIGASIQLERGQCYALIAPNGAGKTTLLRLLTKILPGANCDSSVKVLSFIDATAPFISNLSIELNIHIFQNLHNFDDSKKNVGAILEEAGLQELRHQRIDQLSSGMISRLCLALFRLNRADLYLLDEVLGFGDHGFKSKLKAAIEQKKSEGSIVIQAGHHLDDLRINCDQGIHIEKYQIFIYRDLNKLIEKHQATCCQ